MHEEDGGLSSINILKSGFKIWIVVDHKSRADLEEKVHENLEKMDSSACSQVMKHKLYFVTPYLLETWKIPYTIVIQNPGDMFFIRCGSYHSVINTTLNVAEVINFGCLESNDNYEPLPCKCPESHKQHIYRNAAIISVSGKEKVLHECNFCHEKFVKKKMFDEHCRKMHPRLPCFVCDICKKKYVNMQHLRRHKKEKHTTKPTKNVCKECGAEVARLRDHIRDIHENRKICEFCQKSISHRNFKKHQKDCKNKKEIKCEICGKTFTGKKYLTQHKKHKHIDK
ncbi:hypothetical protein TKK_0002640 [Trichogramma kaykai]